MVIATSTGQILPYRNPFRNYRGSNEERKEVEITHKFGKILSVFFLFLWIL